MKIPFKKPKKVTSVADAIAPLQQIVQNLADVSKHQHDEAVKTEKVIKVLEAKKTACDNEASLADEQVKKMSDMFGLKPTK